MLSNYIFMAGMTAKRYLHKFLKNEKGDTNFISIIIILGVVIGLAGLFIGYGEDIIEEVGGIITGFTAPSFGGGSAGGSAGGGFN